MAIRAVIFDVGGVINHVDEDGKLRQWEQRLGLPERTLRRTIFNGPLTGQCSLGQVSDEQVWAQVGETLGLSAADLRQLEADTWGSYVWDTDLLAYIRSLRLRYKTAVLSDAWVGARRQMQDYINSDSFDVIVISSEEGICKPDPEIFRRTLERLGIAASEAIFVDDKPRNVEAAQALGMKGVVFGDREQARAETERMLAIGRSRP